MKPLEERFHSMMKPRATATDIQTVIVEIDAEVARLGVAADQARAKSLDGGISDADADQARTDEHGLRFAIERWISRKATLAARYAERTQSDAASALRKDYDDAVAETDVLVEDLKARIPVLFTELAALLGRIRANDARIEKANRNRPGGCPGLIGAEQTARGYVGVGQWPNLSPVERLVDIALPRFDGDGRIWPAADIAKPMLHYDVFGDAERAKQASKAEYVVQRTDNRQGTVNLIHADGIFQLGAQAHPCWMFPHQVEAAKGAGMIVLAVDRSSPAYRLGKTIREIGDDLAKRGAA
jgi:hypothetical protein